MSLGHDDRAQLEGRTNNVRREWQSKRYRLVVLAIPLPLLCAWIALELVLLGAVLMGAWFVWQVNTTVMQNGAAQAVTADWAIDAKGRADDAYEIAEAERRHRVERLELVRP